MKTAIRALALAAALIGSGVGIAWSVRLAIADYWFRKETPQATQKAIDWTPGRADYHVRLALLVGEDHPSEAIEALRQAVTLNPHSSRPWIELGLRYEAENRFAEAEKALLRAAEIDKQYEPRWSLMNYYFRRDQTEPFWEWATAAVPMIYGDPSPLFHLCGRVSEDGQLIDRLQIHKVELQAAYLFYLVDMGRADLAGAASRRLLESDRAGDVPLLLDACDRLIDGHRVDDAAAIWNGLAARDRVRRTPISDFSTSPTGHGFDWRLPIVEGVSAAREEKPSGLRLTFSGSEPEQAEVLTQYEPVLGDTAYDFSFRYRTRQIDAGTGLAWRILDAATGRVIHDGQDLAADEPVTKQVSFRTPPECRMIRLALSYQRRPGTVRIAGYIVLQQAGIKPEP